MRTASNIRTSVSSLLLLCLGCGTATPNGLSPDGGGPAKNGTDGGPGTTPVKDGGSHPSDGAIVGPVGGGGDSGTPGNTVVCNVTDPNKDMDGDGWTPAQNDCNDCDPNVNPGAIDVYHTPDGGTPFWGNESCANNPGANAQPCDNGLVLTDTDPNSAAKAIELCQTAMTTDKNFGVISATWVRADGTSYPAPGAQVGIQAGWGTNVKVQGGSNMIALSSGFARSVGQAGACDAITCVTHDAGTIPPTGFPQDDPACPPTKVVVDDVALQVTLRAPTNATGFSFDFKFYSFEFPNWVCDKSGYNDQFVALVSPAPVGAYTPVDGGPGNISFDSNQHPVSVNMGFFDVCDPGSSARFAVNCLKADAGPCPTIPNPYCPMGAGELAGTGFDVWDTKKTEGPAGATKWLQTTAPVTGGSLITITFAIWDAGNYQYDSTVLIDNFQWIANGGAVGVTTHPPQAPQ